MDNIFLNIWEKYGFKANPFSTNALSLHHDSELPIDQAFVGRNSSEEASILKNLLGSEGGNRFIVEGEIGVGKTTFVNYFRYLAEYKVKKKERLFSPFSEISFQHEWEAKDFLVNIISHLLHKLVLIYGLKDVSKNPLFEELLILDKVYLQYSYQIEGQVLGSGVGFGQNKHISIPQISEARLVFYIEEFIKELLKRGYRGVILHFDNLELLTTVQSDKLKKIFQNLRDLLQIPKVYYVFIGQSGFFRRIISPLERVRSIFFGWPIFVPPLTEQEVIETFQRRYELLAMKKLKWIKPVEDECISFLYDLYDGKIRSIMDAIQAIITRFPLHIGKTLLLPQVKQYLFGFMEEKILQLLTKKEFLTLMDAACFDRFSNSQLASNTQQDKSNIGKIIQKFLHFGFIRINGKQGRFVYYEVSEEVKILYKSKYCKKEPQNRTTINYDRRQQQIIDYLKKSPNGINTQKTASLLKISYNTAKRDLELLKQNGRLNKNKKGRTWVYSLSNSY